MPTAAELVELLQLAPHPEGGWYRELHRSREILATPRGPRAALTSIYYLLEATQFSRWHVVGSDEIWQFHAGAPLELVVYVPGSGAVTRRELGGQLPTQDYVGVVPAGEWQAARSLGEWTLVSCVVGPGFDFEDFQFISGLPEHARHFSGALAPYAHLL